MDQAKNKKLYREYCKAHPVPVFCLPYWLDNLCDDWQVLTAEDDGKTTAFLPLALKKKALFKVLIPSPVSVYGGPFFVQEQIPEGAKKYSFYRRCFEQLYNQSQQYSWVQFTTLPPYDYPAAAQWAGFAVQAKTAHVIREFDLLSYRSNIKRKIKKAEKHLEVDEIDFDTFYKVNQKTFDRKNEKLPYNYNTMKTAVEQAVKNRNALILGAINNDDKSVCGGIVFLTDQSGVYLYLSGMDPAQKELGSQPLLTHTGIELARQLKVPFYFCGSNQVSIARFFESFGGIPEVYYVCRAENSGILKHSGVFS